MNLDFHGMQVVITGAAGIVGRRLVQSFAQEGCDLYLIDREAPHDLVVTAQRSGGRNVKFQAIDLTNDEQIAKLCFTIEQEWGAADVLINNAGVYPLNPLLSMTIQEWDTVMTINLRAPFILTKEMARLMIQRKRHGSIINISSGAALRTKVGHGHYSTSKAALEMLTKSFALELAPFNIRVNALAPGFAPGSCGSHLPLDYVQKMAESIPLGRLSGEFDASAAALFLVSSQAAFITGATLSVDGGRGAGILSSLDRKQLIKRGTSREGEI